ncbi:PAS domain S-box protein [bacterium]|nr:PAS domain S-box protein [bacterium]
MEKELKKRLEKRIEALEKQLFEYKRREEQTEIAEKIYGAFVENANDCILTIDTQGIIQSVNTYAVKKIGYKKEEITGKRFIEFVSEKDVEKTGKLLKVIFDNGKSIEDFIINLKSNINGLFPVELNISPLYDDAGHVTLIQIIARDISERELFKENLEINSRKLEESNIQLELANASKSEFLANTTHELRTPLNSIIGFLKLIIDGMIPNKQEEREILNDAYNSAMHLLSIINNILDIAKIEAGKIETHPQKVNIIDLLNEVKNVTSIQAVMKNLSITFDMGSLSYPFVLADYEMLKQIFINVIGNSIKFTDKGKIEIKVLPETEGGFVIINITDTGIGFKEENIEKLFEKFKQADGSFTRKKGGTGLGLTISKSLIEMMQGKISLYSEGVGKGTKAIIKIPVYKNV